MKTFVKCIYKTLNYYYGNCYIIHTALTLTGEVLLCTVLDFFFSFLSRNNLGVTIYGYMAKNLILKKKKKKHGKVLYYIHYCIHVSL